MANIDHPSLHLNEQAWTSAPLDLAARLMETDSASWLLPFLRLAGEEGERAGLRLLSDSPTLTTLRSESSLTLLEEIDLDEPVIEGEQVVRRGLRWRTAGFAVLFRRLDGLLAVEGADDGSVLSLCGGLEFPSHLSASPEGMTAGRRAAETAGRALLAHLRSALEDPSAVRMLA